MARRRVGWFVADRDTFGPSVGKPVKPSGEYVASDPLLLVFVFGAHWFDDAGSGDWVVSEQTMPRVVVVAVEHHQIEVGTIGRRFEQSVLGERRIPFGHVMWPWCNLGSRHQ